MSVRVMNIQQQTMASLVDNQIINYHQQAIATVSDDSLVNLQGQVLASVNEHGFEIVTGTSIKVSDGNIYGLDGSVIGTVEGGTTAQQKLLAAAYFLYFLS